VACGPHQAPQRQGLGAQRREDNVIVHLFSAVRKTAQAPPVTGDTRSGHVFRASAVGLYCETHSSGTSSMAVSRSLGAFVLLIGLGSALFDPAPAQRDSGAASPDSTGVAGQLVELPEVVVKGTTRLADRRFADFERRRQSGMGAFLTQDRIEHANTTSLVDVLVTVRGVQQVCISNECIAKMVRSPPGCYPQYYLDGKESSAYFARLTPPQDVKGVEIYRGSSETPGEFQGSNSGCGVIAIWTKSSP